MIYKDMNAGHWTKRNLTISSFRATSESPAPSISILCKYHVFTDLSGSDTRAQIFLGEHIRDIRLDFQDESLKLC